MKCSFCNQRSAITCHECAGWAIDKAKEHASRDGLTRIRDLEAALRHFEVQGDSYGALCVCGATMGPKDEHRWGCILKTLSRSEPVGVTTENPRDER